MTSYYEKYSKYKRKYFDLKKQLGGNISININELNLTTRIKDAIIELKQYRNTDESEEAYNTRINLFNYTTDDAGPLKFQSKYDSYNKFNQELTIETLIYCFSLNNEDQDHARCNEFKFDDLTDEYTKEIDPISISRQLDGTYNIINGRHRVAAHIIKNNNIIIGTIV
jgi:hypothetical protein